MRVLIADVFPEQYLTDLKTLGLEVVYDPNVKANELGARANGAGILIVRSKKVDRATIEAAPSLALILRAGAGYDTIDVQAASERGIFVSNCPGKNAVAVAELAFGLILALDRRLVDSTTDLTNGKWNKKEYGKAEGLKGRTIGVVGLGSIGLAVIDRARAFEMHTLAWSRSLTGLRADELGVGYCRTAEELAERSDIVTIHLAQTKETKGICGPAFFQRMKKKAIFINTSRGGLHDEAALIAAVKERQLRVGLDVFANEPAEGTASDLKNELFGLPGFVGSHHIGASTEQAQNAIAEETVRICREYLATGRPPNVVNIELRAPAKCELIVRHYDKVGVLAQVLGLIRKYGINVAEMSNTIFQGEKAALASIRIGSEPPSEMIAEISKLEDCVIQVEVKRPH